MLREMGGAKPKLSSAKTTGTIVFTLPRASGFHSLPEENGCFPPLLSDVAWTGYESVA